MATTKDDKGQQCKTEISCFCNDLLQLIDFQVTLEEALVQRNFKGESFLFAHLPGSTYHQSRREAWNMLLELNEKIET